MALELQTGDIRERVVGTLMNSLSHHEKPALVVGDVHGHFDRLERFLLQEGIVDTCPDCDGTGDKPADGDYAGFQFHADPDLGESEIVFTHDALMCEACNGDGSRRVNYDVRVIQLGDLGHFGGNSGTPTGDKMCYLYASRWFDEVLWGNHDRALVDPHHIFGGFEFPDDTTWKLVNLLADEGKLKLATSAHGYLIVHAGVHLGYRYWFGDNDAEGAAKALNDLDQKKLAVIQEEGPPVHNIDALKRRREFKVLDGIPRVRGGSYPEGGVLWMDWNDEKHLRGEPFKYICGHTADRDGLIRNDPWGNWNIDIGGKNETRLGGVWLEAGKDPRPVKVEL